jgi:hypothetical protein
VIAVNEMILLHQELRNIEDNSQFLNYARRLQRATINMSLAPKAVMETDAMVELGGHDPIFLNSTANKKEYARERYATHGLVYADYYFLGAGNALLRLLEDRD